MIFLEEDDIKSYKKEIQYQINFIRRRIELVQNKKPISEKFVHDDELDQIQGLIYDLEDVIDRYETLEKHYK